MTLIILVKEVDGMRKFIICLLSLLLLAGCGTKKTENKTKTTTKTVDPIKLSDLYGKRYVQDTIVYANKSQYASKQSAYDSELTYMLKKNSIVFETDLTYSDVSYKSAKITENDKKIIKDIAKKYTVETDDSALGMTIMLSKTRFYIANNTLNQKGYTYVAKLKQAATVTTTK